MGRLLVSIFLLLLTGSLLLNGFQWLAVERLEMERKVLKAEVKSCLELVRKSPEHVD